MFRFGVKNLRRLRNVKPVELRPITILVGRNSSGKSTFLRTFPLLRQSLMTRTSSPILWYGDFVDFGSFEGVVSDNDMSDKISFVFGLDEIRLSNNYLSQYAYHGWEYDRKIGPIEVEFFISAKENKTRLDSFIISMGHGEVVFEVGIDDAGVMSTLNLNGKTIYDLFENYRVAFPVGSIFPEPSIRLKEQSDISPRLFVRNTSSLVQPMADLIRNHVDKRTRQEVLERFSIEFLSMPEFSDLEIERLQGRTTNRSFGKLLADLRGKNVKDLKSAAHRIFVANQFLPMASATFEKLRLILSGTLYIGPARARSERYYRYQELAVSEIDSDGKNFPMFLNSLSDRQLQSFSRWVQSRFGYGVELLRLQGHISINLSVDGNVTNIVDNGYGISQVLPVLGQIWWASNRPRNAQPISFRDGFPQSSILVIEQPELHLHPAHQALLADALVGEQKKSQDKQKIAPSIQFVVETHSEAMVNRLGELISERKISQSDVQILIFDPDIDDYRCTVVRIAEFSEDGTLKNWPYGFFQPGLHS